MKPFSKKLNSFLMLRILNEKNIMSVIRGTLSIQLDAQEMHEYVKGDILNIPYNVKMNVGNKHDETLEIFVIKAPNPKDYVKK